IAMHSTIRVGQWDAFEQTAPQHKGHGGSSEYTARCESGRTVRAFMLVHSRPRRALRMVELWCQSAPFFQCSVWRSLEVIVLSRFTLQAFYLPLCHAWIA